MRNVDRSSGISTPRSQLWQRLNRWEKCSAAGHSGDLLLPLPSWTGSGRIAGLPVEFPGHFSGALADIDQRAAAFFTF
jgi:hypothetical protein